MALSMTGYGRGHNEEKGKRVTIEVKSVNHRFVEVNVKTFFRMFMLDDLVRKTIKKKFHRGYFDVNITVFSDNDSISQVTVNDKLLAGYISAAAALSRKFGISDPPTMGDIFQIKDLFTVSDQDLKLNEWRSMIEKALTLSLDQVEKIRKAEGASTLKFIKQKFRKISGLLGKIEKTNKGSSKERYGKLLLKIKKLSGAGDMDQDRLIQEVAIIADRCDISEELDRLRSHLKQISGLFASGEAIGRKLEFFLQEINREANTVGSKISSATGTANVVEIKSDLEKIREQAQNME